MFELSPEQRMVSQMVRKWCETHLAPAVGALEAGEQQPFELMKKMARAFGLDGMAKAALAKRLQAMRGKAPGAEAGDDAAAPGGERGPFGDDPMIGFVVVKELSRVSPGFAMGWGVSVGLAGGAIIGRGTADQIERWGVPLATMDKIGAWCLTEPGAGSDAFGSMRTFARADGGDFVLRGSKTFITNGPGADLFVVYARIEDTDGGVGAFVVERGAPGFSVGPPLKKMGMRDSPTSEIFFDDVRLPAEHLLGGRDGDGDGSDGSDGGRAGRQKAKQSLQAERSAVPAMAWGIMERCYEQSLRYARERVQFGKPIGDFQAVQLKLADMYIKLKNVENLVYRTAWLMKRRIDDVAFVDASKAHAAQMAVDVALTAIQIHGGYGYMEEVGLEKMARDAKLLELGAGTTDINLLGAARAELARIG